jgi:copper chaperone CopZ
MLNTHMPDWSALFCQAERALDGIEGVSACHCGYWQRRPVFRLIAENVSPSRIAGALKEVGLKPASIWAFTLSDAWRKELSTHLPERRVRRLIVFTSMREESPRWEYHSSCIEHVEENLAEVPGVSEVSSTWQDGRRVFRLRADRIRDEHIRNVFRCCAVVERISDDLELV